mgnify:CR=1 FL=1
MGLGKTYSTQYLADSNNNTGAAGQVLISTSTGVNWSDGTDIIGGPYLPLAGGTLTGGLIGTSANFVGTIRSTLASDNSYYSLFSNNGSLVLDTAGVNSGMQFKILGSTKLTMNNGGNVGIGTTGPVGLLHLYDGSPVIQIMTNSGADGQTSTTMGRIIGQARGYGMAGDEMCSIDFETNATAWYKGDIVFKTNDSDGTDPSIDATSKMRILSNGNVGIGTDSPVYKLDVAGEIGLDSYLRHNGDSDTFFGFSGNDEIKFRTAGSDRVFINSTGNVGIGTTSPIGCLDIDDTYKEEGNLRLGDSTVYGGGWARGMITLYQNTSTGSKNFVRQGMLGTGDALSYYWHSMDTTTTTPWSVNAFRIYPNNNVIAGFLNGNVGIGTTSPKSKLHVDGNVQMENGGMLSFYSGAGANAENIGIKGTDATGTLTFHTEAVERMRIDNTGNVGIGTTNADSKLKVEASSGGAVYAGFRVGYAGVSANYYDANTHNIRNGNSSTQYVTINSTGVGIGTTSPGAKLEVNGQIIINSTALGGQDAFSIYNSTNQLFHIQNSSTDDEASLLLGANNVIKVKLDTAGNSYLNGGNVGIGNTNPSSALSISKSMGAAFIADFINPAVNGHGLLIQAGGTTGTRYITQWKDALGTERFHMEDDGEAYFQGNVGIGTTGPTFKLHVNSTDASDNVAYIHHNNAAQSSGDVLKVRSDAGDNAGSALLNVANNTGSALYVRGDRNVGIGTTSPGSKLTVVAPLGGIGTDFQISGGSGFGTKNVKIEIPGYGDGLQITSVASSTVDDNAITFYQDANKRGSIVVNATSTSYNTTSDYRLKENKEDISDAIERVKSLKPVKFNWISEPNQPKVDGFYAHELAEIVPQAVTGKKDALDYENKPDHQSIDQSKIVPLLTAALQQAIDKIEALEQRIQLIENK